MRQQEILGCRRKSVDVSLEFPVEMLYEETRQGKYVLGPLSQRRHRELNNVQSIVKVLP
jgi:hypothetical protein